jgi:hypothetical protein
MKYEKPNTYQHPYVCAASFAILFSYYFIGHDMFQAYWPSSGVQVVMARDSAAHCNAVFFPPIVVASGYVGYHQFYLGVRGLHVVAFGFVWFVGCGCLECSATARMSKGDNGNICNKNCDKAGTIVELG